GKQRGSSTRCLRTPFELTNARIVFSTFQVSLSLSLSLSLHIRTHSLFLLALFSSLKISLFHIHTALFSFTSSFSCTLSITPFREFVRFQISFSFRCFLPQIDARELPFMDAADARSSLRDMFP